MIPNNYYPVLYSDFLRIKSTGNYVIMYAILDDRVHLEMAIENGVFVTQKFLTDINSEIKAMADNYKADKVEMFLKMSLNTNTFYRYYPTREQIVELKKIKLYTGLEVQEIQVGIYSGKDLKLFESDQLIKAFNGNTLIMKAHKVK